jgi:hypothetical protein
VTGDITGQTGVPQLCESWVLVVARLVSSLEEMFVLKRPSSTR